MVINQFLLVVFIGLMLNYGKRKLGYEFRACEQPNKSCGIEYNDHFIGAVQCFNQIGYGITVMLNKSIEQRNPHKSCGDFSKLVKLII